MRKVWQSLRNENVMSGALFRGGNEKLSSNADVLHKTSNLIISRCCFADDEGYDSDNATRKEHHWLKEENNRAARAARI